MQRGGPSPHGHGLRARDELEVGRERDRERLARDAHDAILERLAHRLERVGRELAELVEEEHAPVREGDLAGSGAAAAAADERGGRRGVVRGAERAGAGEAAGRVRARRRSGCAVTSRASSWVERREDRGEPAGEHRLAGAGRAGEQQVVAAGGGGLERAAGPGEAADLGEVDGSRRLDSSGAAGAGQSGQVVFALQARAQLGEVAGGADLHAV